VQHLGIAVVVPNIRGSTGYGAAYQHLDDRRLRENAVKDVGELLKWVADQRALDSNRVAVMGGSYGGYLVLASLVHFGKKIRAGIDMVGIVDFVTYLENTSPYRRDGRRGEYGDERDPKMRAFLSSIAPLAHVDKIQSPLFVVQGANDPVVPKSQSDRLVAALKNKGQEVWYLVALDEGHGLVKKKNRMFYWQTVVDFLDRHLLVDEAPKQKNSIKN